MSLSTGSGLAVSGEQALFEAHIIRGAALSRMAAFTAALEPMVRAMRQLGINMAQATAGLRRALEQINAAGNVRAPG